VDAEEEVEEEEAEDGEEEDEEKFIAKADEEGAVIDKKVAAIDKEVSVIDQKDAAIDEDLLDDYLTNSVNQDTVAAGERRRISAEYPANTVFIAEIKSRKEVLLAIAAWG
jgi:hypothetical protein